MASSESYAAYVLEQLDLLPEITHRKMMGEYILYYKGVVFGGIFDDRLLVKATDAGRRLMPEAEAAIPYPGGKPKLLVENLDDKEMLRTLVIETVKELPATPAKRKH